MTRADRPQFPGTTRTEGAKHPVVTAYGFFYRLKIEYVARLKMKIGVSQVVQFFRKADECCDVVTLFEGLQDELPSDGAACAKND